MAVRLLLLPVLGVAACQSGPPIRLNPVKAQYAPQRRVARASAVTPPSARQAAAAADSSCAAPVLQGLTGARKDELFRQFAAVEGQPAGAGAAPASPAACQPAGR